MPTEHGHIQSVLFSKSAWTLNKARAWLRKHNYKVKKVDITKSLYRFRQLPPDKFKKYRLIHITPTIKLVLGYNT
jgi:hypothetical protein